ncbi:MAG: hypothetical protein K8S24_09770 [Candidatus Aegiribacteria sp.]|nr:hypothetical protein [Candidatus Aegiribacteria sp.]
MNYQKFSENWEQEWGKTELGAIRAFLIGVIEYLDNPEEGSRMIALTLPEQYLCQDGSPGRDAFLEYFSNDGGNSAKSYLGGTPENSYSYDYDHSLEMLANSVRGDWESKIFIQSGGKDMPTPVHLRKNSDGIWKLFNVSSLATGVKRIKSGDF